MAEHHPSLNEVESKHHLLADVMHLMQTLHARSLRQKPDDDHVIDRMLRQLGTETRRIMLSHLRTIERRINRRSDATSPEVIARNTALLRQMRRERITNVFAENWYDSILSTPEYPIHAKGYGRFLLHTAVREFVREQAPPEAFQHIGWISFDTNGLKTMIDCTTYGNATRYLQAIARLLLDREGRTRRWMEEMDIRVTPLAAGGDEFALFLHASSHLDAPLLKEIIAGYQEEVSDSTELRSFLDFDARETLLNFGLPTERERERFLTLGIAEQEQELRRIRASLPALFVPTIAGGGATLDEGIVRAVESGSLNPAHSTETFDTARETMRRHLVELAEARQAENKATFKRSVQATDPLFHSFLLRNGENRQLAKKKEDLERRLCQVEEDNTSKQREIDELRTLVDDLQRQLKLHVGGQDERAIQMKVS